MTTSRTVSIPARVCHSSAECSCQRTEMCALLLCLPDQERQDRRQGDEGAGREDDAAQQERLDHRIPGRLQGHQ